MILSSGTYLIFLTVCVMLHTLLGHRFRNFFLLLASVSFFLHAMPAQTVVMLVFCLAVFSLGRAIHASSGKTRSLLLTAGIALGVGLLVFYKYLSFLGSLLGLASRTWMQDLVVPLGISYVTFQCIAYLVEIHKQRMKPEENPVDFLIYVFFFPKLTAGPIEPPQAFLAQLKTPRRCSVSGARLALLRIAMGFIKKIAVADVVAPCVNAAYGTPNPQGWVGMLAIILYAVQLLFDFSGYTDIARGSAALFGIDLTENFNAPYRARSIREFWKRWHISLSSWLRTYIFIPLGGSRVAAWRRYANIMAVFLVSGIWHGASMTFVVWGLLHGALQVAEMLLEPAGKKISAALPDRVWDALRWLRTTVLVCVCWVFFRAPDLTTAWTLLAGLFGEWGSLPGAMELCGLTGTMVFLSAAAAFCASRLRRYLERVRAPGFWETLSLCVLSAWAVLLVYLVQTASGNVSSFIYFDF